MKIAIASSELAPVAQSGGLGDAVAGLAAQLNRNGHDVCVVLPCYKSVRQHSGWKPKDTGVAIEIPLGHQSASAEILEYRKRGGHQVFLIRNDAMFDRDGLYGDRDGAFSDNARRFIFFSRAAYELCRRMEPQPDIIHAHDWQAALIPVLVKAGRARFRTLLTLHNVAYQGRFWSLDFALTGLPPEWFSPGGLEFHGDLNLLKGGILAADSLVTVSAAYARDILTPEAGCGLDAVLREQRGKLDGFLAGADYTVWNPASDKLLPRNYRPGALKGKLACREALLEKLDLTPVPDAPVFMMTTRLDEQKGLDVFLPLIDRLLADDVRLVILGAGDPRYMAELTVAARKYPRKLAYLESADSALEHLVLAGADIAIMPARAEPAGHSAVRCLKYGTIPVARDTGGLHEIVRDFDPTAGDGWGVVFYNYSSEALWDAIMRARSLFADSALWKQLVKRAMKCNFSWERAAAGYESLYNQLLKR